MAKSKNSEGTLLQANPSVVDCRVKPGEVQVCFGSNFTAREIPNPALEDEFPEEGIPETVVVLVGEFTKEEEIESLLRSKRAVRFTATESVKTEE